MTVVFIIILCSAFLATACIMEIFQEEIIISQIESPEKRILLTTIYGAFFGIVFFWVSPFLLEAAEEFYGNSMTTYATALLLHAIVFILIFAATFVLGLVYRTVKNFIIKTIVEKYGNAIVHDKIIVEPEKATEAKNQN